MKGDLINSRTRRRRIPDWYSQGAGFSIKLWGDTPPFNDGRNPKLNLDQTKRNPDWDQSYSSFKGQEVTSDATHGIRSARELRAQTGGDIGGSFFNQKKFAIAHSAGDKTLLGEGINTNNGNWERMQYTGPVFAVNPTDDKYPTYVPGDLNAKGATAISRCKPTNNVVDLSTTLGETIREGLPHLLGQATWKPKTKAARRAAGDEYLNVQFGWLPLVSDIRGASYALANAHRLIEAYERNSGKQVRRRYEFPVEQTESTVDLGPRDAELFTGQYKPGVIFDVSKPQPHLIRTTKFYRRTWFSGAFTYHLPNSYASREWVARYQAQAQHLLGLELTPSTVWNLAPWSWAVDWVSNLGDVINNISDWSSDGLVMRYGYIMEHTLQTVTYSLDGPTRFKPYGSVFASSLTFTLETKRRQPASPFGFGVSFNSLTSRQKAIVVALGLSRS